ncbi:MAG: hypothetical protein Q9200_001282 [Gallowayella weberi]
MSRLPNGTNGYMNGDHGSDHAKNYDSSYRDVASTGGRREYRLDGYGGFNTNISNLSVPPNADQGTSALADERSTGIHNGFGYARARVGDSIQEGGQAGGGTRERDGQHAAVLYGNGPGGRQIEDALIADKNFLAAVDLLQDALRTIRRSETESITALSDLKVYFSNQETSLTDILMEELHDHLYLKALGSQDRWTSYSSYMSQDPGNKTPGSLPHTWGRPLYVFLNSLDLSLPMVDDASSNLPSDSFRYIHMLLEALDRVGCLDIAIDRVEQRLPVELFNIVDRTNQEVDLRHPAPLRDTNDRLEHVLITHDLHDAKRRSEVLEDLLGTLYAKFEAVAEGHRVVHDVVLGIGRRNGYRHLGNLTGSFKELWKLYQSELRSLLHDYITTDEDTLTKFGRSGSGEGNLLQKSRRDKSKRVFKLAEIDQKTSDLTVEQEDLDRMLQHSVPGLVSKFQRRSETQLSKGPVSKGGPATHKLLAESSVFNIALMLPPSLSFLQRLKEIVPPDSNIAVSTFTSFLDDFLVNVFLPQLEETVTELCTASCTDLDAFNEDPRWRQRSARPILKVPL